MRYLRICTLTVIILISVVLLAGCGGNSGGASNERRVPNEQRVQNDLAENARSPIPATQSINSIEIIESETDNDAGTHAVFSKVFSRDDEVAYINYMWVRYERDAERNWILTAIALDRSNPQTTSPLIGANEALVRESLMGAVLRIGEDDWRIDDNNLEGFSIASRETNLEQNRDIVIATVELKCDVLTAEGQMHMEFRFDNGWRMTSHRMDAPFTTSVQQHARLEATDSALIGVIDNRSIPFSSAVARSESDILIDRAVGDIAGALLGMPFLSGLAQTPDPSAQTISVSANEISDFTVLHSTVSNKGRVQNFYCYFVLGKELATFAVNANVTYEYDAVSGWIAQDVSFVTAVQSVDLSGTRWTGQCGSNSTGINARWMQFIMEITEFNEDGTMRATMNFPGEQYSHTSTGYFDKSNLTLTFNFEEWIQLPQRFGREVARGSSIARTYETSLNGYFHIDDLSLKSIWQRDRNIFDVTLAR